MIVRQRVYRDIADNTSIDSPFPQSRYTDIVALAGSATVRTVIFNPEDETDPIVIGAGDLVDSVSGDIANVTYPIDALNFQNISSDFVVLIRCYDYA